MELFKLGYSWGGYESLMVPTYPATLRSSTQWAAAGPSIRIHVGLEDVDDLIADLEGGFGPLERRVACHVRKAIVVASDAPQTRRALARFVDPVRFAARFVRGRFPISPISVAHGYVQGNLVILPAKHARRSRNSAGRIPSHAHCSEFRSQAVLTSQVSPRTWICAVTWASTRFSAMAADRGVENDIRQPVARAIWWHSCSVARFPSSTSSCMQAFRLRHIREKSVSPMYMTNIDTVPRRARLPESWWYPCAACVLPTLFVPCSLPLGSPSSTEPHTYRQAGNDRSERSTMPTEVTV